MHHAEITVVIRADSYHQLSILTHAFCCFLAHTSL